MKGVFWGLEGLKKGGGVKKGGFALLFLQSQCFEN
jgi:hypothetical protein